MSFKSKAWTPRTDLSEQELKKMKDAVLEKITVARVALLLRHPFFGNMATRLRVKNGDDFCNTAATDGRNLYYNTQFFNELSHKQVEFVIGHEIYHCIYEHLIRTETRDPKLFNIAADYVVNNQLIANKIGDVVTQIPIFKDPKYTGWITEEVYDDLLQKYDDEELEQLGKLLDDHIDWEGEDEKDGSKRPSYSKEELRKIRDELKEAMMSSAAAAGAGNVPGDIARMIKDLTEHKMNWRELIRQQIQSLVKSDFTFARPSRKGWHTGAVLPGMNIKDRIEIAVAIDMSGSITDAMARDMLSEVKGITEEFEDYEVRVWCFDTKVYNDETFTSDDGLDIASYETKGGGGTDFMCNWKYMREQDFQPKKLILFTDMYPWDSWGEPDYCDTIFINHGRAGFEAPFGITVEYEFNN